MQALCVLCPKEPSGAFPAGCSQIRRRPSPGLQGRRKRGWGIGDSSHGCLLMCVSGTLALHSKLGLVFLHGRKKKTAFLASLTLAWTLEETSECEFDRKNSKIWTSEDDETGYVSVDGLGANGVSSVEVGEGIMSDEGELPTARGVEHTGGGQSIIRDVRELAKSIWLAKTADDVERALGKLEDLPLCAYSSMIKCLGKDKRLDSAFALVEWLKRKRSEKDGKFGLNIFTYNSLLSAIKQSGQLENADKVMEDMACQDIRPNVVTYNTLMSVYMEQGKYSEANSILTTMENHGIYPSPATYYMALLGYQRTGDANGALAFFLELRRRYMGGAIVRVSDEDWEHEFIKLMDLTVHICYQVMRQWLVKKDGLSSSMVLRLLNDMDRAEVSLRRAECEKLLWACTDENDYIIARELYRRTRDMQTGISLSVCNHIIWLMGKSKKWWAALEIYEDLLEKGPKPNNVSYELIVSHFNVLLSAASKRGFWRWGVRLLNKMLDKGLKPGAKEWNAVLIACSRASEASAAVEIFKNMIDQGEKPSIVSYGALLSALEKGKLYDEALHVWDHMSKVGIRPNLYAYTILSTIYIGKGDLEQVDAVIRDMISSGIKPTVVTYNAIISGCARQSLGSAAFYWFHRMKFRNVKPNKVTYEMLIEALAQDAKPRLAYEMYRRSCNEGLILSSKAYDSVVRSYQAYGASIEIDALCP